MYIFEIPEIEEIFFSYLDYCIDFNVLKLINKNYRDIISSHHIYIKLCNFDVNHLISIENKFVKACQTDIFVAKYLFYKYTNINIHHNYEDSFFASCHSGHLDIAQWLWQYYCKLINPS